MGLHHSNVNTRSSPDLALHLIPVGRSSSSSPPLTARSGRHTSPRQLSDSPVLAPLSGRNTGLTPRCSAGRASMSPRVGSSSSLLPPRPSLNGVRSAQLARGISQPLLPPGGLAPSAVPSPV